MAIGSGLGGSGPSNQSPGLSSGTKWRTGTNPEATDTGSDIFAGLYEFKQHQDSLKQENQHADAGDLVKKYQQGDKSTGSALLKTLEPTIKAAISNLTGGDERYLTRARIMALDSIKGFDPSRGVALNTYVYNRLQGLRRLSADRGNFIHVPEKSALERRQLEEIKRDYVLENGVEPSLSMLADKSGMSVDKVGRLMSIFGTTSTSTTRGEHGDSLEAKRRTANELYIDTFYNELPEIDKKIYEWTTGYKGSPQLDRATIAKRLKISEAAISQHAHKIDKLAARFNRQLTDTIYGKDTDD